MRTKNINYENFNYKLNKVQQKKIVSSLNLNKLILKYPLLKSLCSNYKYGVTKNNLKKLKKYKSYNLIGMGGSILGAQAIYDFLIKKINKKFIFYNNLKSNENFSNDKKSLNIVVSKSGNTLETFANINLILSHQKKNDNLIITENKNSILNKLATKIKADVIEHKNYIGGRYSVLSEVGMVPAELMGLKEKKFKRLNYLIKNKFFIKFLVNNVLCIYKNIKQGKRNSVILNYDESSNNFLEWYKQLTAESLGKSNKGLFPIISTMPKDNHSLLQLYLDGYKNNFFTFFSSKKFKSNNFSKLYLINGYKNLKNKNIDDIIYAQKKATQNIFKNKKIPFRCFEILNKNEEALGELFCFFILETLLLAKLLKVNALDQPSVELIKKETKKIL